MTWRRTVTFTATSDAGAQASKRHESFGGDLGVSLLGVALRERAGRPNVIVSLDAVLPTGPGDRGLGASVVLARSLDPAVLFASLGYLHGFSLDPGDGHRSLARHNVSAVFGTTFALNDTLALNGAFNASYRMSPTGATGLAPSRDSYALQFGMTWMWARNVFVEPAVAVRVGGDRPDMTFSLSVPYTF
jgi:hypothetical protein